MLMIDTVAWISISSSSESKFWVSNAIRIFLRLKFFSLVAIAIAIDSANFLDSKVLLS